MKKQILSIFICTLMILGAVVIIPQNVDAVTTPPIQHLIPGQEPRQIDELNYSYVHQITDWLSGVIASSYNQNPGQHELAKGREFGSKGEHDAATYLYYRMLELNLSQVKLEKIIPIDKCDFTLPNPKVQEFVLNSTNNSILSQFNVTSIALTLNHGTQHSTLKDSEFFITPYWGFLKEFNKGMYNGSLVNYSFNNVKIFRGTRLILLFFTECLKHLVEILKYIHDHDPNSDELYDFIENLIETDYNFSINKIDPENLSTIPSFWNDMECPPIGCSDKFVLISEDIWNNLGDIPLDRWLYNPITTYTNIAFGWHMKAVNFTQRICHAIYPQTFKGNLMYDMNHNEKVHDMPGLAWSPLPVILVNNTWEDIKENPCCYSINFTLHEKFQNNTTSYNVIGAIPGKNTSKTILIDCLYDCKWNQGTADSAIGMGIVMAIAKEMKYLRDNYNITPKYTVKFVAFSGEEEGNRGAYYYDANHSKENITYMIDLNQVGFTERYNHLILNVFTNKLLFSNRIKSLTDETNYVQRVGGVSDFRINYQPNIRAFGDFYPFVQSRHDLNMMCFLEDTGWSLHHRSGGNNYQYGDVMDYYNETKIKAVGEMIWNTTKYLAYNHNASFDDTAPQTYCSKDVDGDGSMDSIRANFTINTTLPHDRVTVRAKLIDTNNDTCMITRKDFDIDYFSKHCTMTVTLPPNATAGAYRLELELLNDTERIEDKQCKYNDPDHLSGIANDSIGTGMNYFSLHPRGDTRPEKPTFSLEGNAPVRIFQPRNYIANSVDPNGDDVVFSVDWDSWEGEITYFPVMSGENSVLPYEYLIGG